MVVTDGDLVFKLLSLPAEAREELLSLLGEPEAHSASETSEIVLQRLSESIRRSARRKGL